MAHKEIRFAATMGSGITQTGVPSAQYTFPASTTRLWESTTVRQVQYLQIYNVDDVYAIKFFSDSSLAQLLYLILKNWGTNSSNHALSS